MTVAPAGAPRTTDTRVHVANTVAIGVLDVLDVLDGLQTRPRSAALWSRRHCGRRTT